MTIILIVTGRKQLVVEVGARVEEILTGGENLVEIIYTGRWVMVGRSW